MCKPLVWTWESNCKSLGCGEREEGREGGKEEREGQRKEGRRNMLGAGTFSGGTKKRQRGKGQGGNSTTPYLCAARSSPELSSNITFQTELFSATWVSSSKLQKVDFSPVFHNWQHKNNVKRKHR